MRIWGPVWRKLPSLYEWRRFAWESVSKLYYSARQMGVGCQSGSDRLYALWSVTLSQFERTDCESGARSGADCPACMNGGDLRGNVSEKCTIRRAKWRSAARVVQIGCILFRNRAVARWCLSGFCQVFCYLPLVRYLKVPSFLCRRSSRTDLKDRPGAATRSACARAARVRAAGADGWRWPAEPLVSSRPL